MKKIRIEPVPGTDLAENKDWAAEARETTVLPAVEAGEPVEFNFAAIETATQSFIHALIAEAVRRRGDDAFDLLRFKNCSAGVQHVVRTVFEYTLLAKLAQENGGPAEEPADASDSGSD